MIFEAHLTLTVPERRLPSIRHWVDVQGLKLTCIELDCGAHPTQLMVTAHLDTDLPGAMQAARELGVAAKAQGEVDVTRTKLEAPMSDETSAMLDRGLYIEHHIKVHTATADVASVARLGALNGAHASRNAFSVLENGMQERFLTQRAATGAFEASLGSLSRLCAELAGNGFSVLKIERELVLCDDNLALDAGWAKDPSP